MYNIKDGRKKEPGIAKTSLGHLLFDSTKLETGQQWYNQLSKFCNKHAGINCLRKLPPEKMIALSKHSVQTEQLSIKQPLFDVCSDYTLNESAITRSNQYSLRHSI